MQPLITRALLNWVDAHKSSSPVTVKFNFECKCLSVDPYSGRLIYDKQNFIQSATYDLIIGADGARSVVKYAVTAQPSVSFEGFDMMTRWKFVPLEINGNSDFINASGFFDIEGNVFLNLLMILYAVLIQYLSLYV